MKRKVKLSLDNGGGELDSAVWQVHVNVEGQVADEEALDARVKKQMDLWEIHVGDTISLSFAD